ncbi:hypothetical protein RN001_013818 [Aquatica leii]|uniref:Actin n=1 Tax=Aquatica leii TaxID=1421715 RepID=A0AAN7QDH1_9COLE|nr:hypothetical protein RN001_013818 [Aquatica leii]
MTEESKPAVVLDHGTLTTRAGLSDNNEPILFSSQTKSLKHPIGGGLINDFTAMEELWQEIFDALAVNSKEHRVLLTEPLCNDEKNRRNTTEIMFETFNVPAMYLAPSSVLALYSGGRINGIVYTSGSTFGTTYAVPILDGHIVRFAYGRIPVGGDTFDHTLKNSLAERYSLIQYVNDAAIRKIKESTCYVAQDYERELHLHNSIDYTLPDGQVITLGEERFRCAEGNFNPFMLDVESEGIHTLINNTIMKCDEVSRKSLFANIVLDGGCTMFTGLAERLQKEMEKISPLQTRVKVYASPRRTEAVWRGGTLLASLPTFKKWVTKDEYSESGHRVMHTKCF